MAAFNRSTADNMLDCSVGGAALPEIVPVGVGGKDELDSWASLTIRGPDTAPHLLMLGMEGDHSALLKQIDTVLPHSQVLGGILPTGAAMYSPLSSVPIQQDSLVGLLIDSANVNMDVIVSTGVEAIGREYTVTGVHSNGQIITELDGDAPHKAIEQVVETALGIHHGTESIVTPQSWLMLGLTADGKSRDSNIHPSQHRADSTVLRPLSSFTHTDIRKMTTSHQTGIPFAGGHGLIEIGSVVQFQLLSPQTCKDDLSAKLEANKAKLEAADAILMFSSVGRGKALYLEDDVESGMLHEAIGGDPLWNPIAGCFTIGEISPVGARTYSQTFTTSIAILSAC